jgi:hypothetical protein
VHCWREFKTVQLSPTVKHVVWLGEIPPRDTPKTRDVCECSEHSIFFFFWVVVILGIELKALDLLGNSSAI